MSELGNSFPLNENKLKSVSGGETMSSLGKSFPANVDKLKSEIGSSGGISTAVVTLTCAEGNLTSLNGAVVLSEDDDRWTENGVSNVESGTEVTVVLADGNGVFSVPFASSITVVSGNAEVTGGYNLAVHGDCTIYVEYGGEAE